jgi:hypothetical protein
MNPRKVLAIYEEIGVTIHGFSLCSGLRAAPGVAAPGARPPPSGKSPKLTNPRFASGELRANFQLSTHRLDGFAQRAYKDVGAAFDLGHASLIDAQRLCESQNADFYCGVSGPYFSYFRFD